MKSDLHRKSSFESCVSIGARTWCQRVVSKTVIVAIDRVVSKTVIYAMIVSCRF